MHETASIAVPVHQLTILSRFLEREVKIDFFLPPEGYAGIPGLLLINDGQDMATMNFEKILRECYISHSIQPLICCAIHAGPERRMEYGTQLFPDYKSRGIKAALYNSFIFDELLPLAEARFNGGSRYREKAFAGFSLGGLSALDIVWNRPGEFTRAGVFSASLWWRSLDQDDPAYDDSQHRIMHQQVRMGGYAPWLKFFFQCGALDETKDRNNNGIIDSIDDTMDLIRELESKGYKKGVDIEYLELADGSHDVPTWGRAMPLFLQWGWPAAQ